MEWEKAARGVDGRIFPWGDKFDATFCKMRNSRPEAPQPEPVGAFSFDTSPYGVRDCSGGVREWVITEPSAAHLDEEVTRGGSWNRDAKAVRSCSRIWLHSTARNGGLGFRLSISIPS